MKLNIKLSNCAMYLLILAFLFPVGFENYSPTYKIIAIAYLYLAVLSSIFYVIFNINYITKKKETRFFLLYALYIIINTLIQKKEFGEGLQQMFVLPIACLIFSIYIDKYKTNALLCFSRLISVLLFFNLFIFNGLFFAGKFKRLFQEDFHVIFIGHVQVLAQIGLLGIFLSILLNKIGYKKDCKVLILLSILNMVYSQTALSYITLGLLLIGFLLYRYKHSLLELKTYIYFLIPFGANLLLFIVLIVKNWRLEIANSIITFSGRTFIWKNVLDLILQKMFLGYGVCGKKIDVFWLQWVKDDTLYYTHNEFLQLCLDGGIILLLLFFILTYLNLKKVNNMEEISCVVNVFIFTFAIAMIIESVTIYSYYYLFITVISKLPELLEIRPEGGRLKNATHENNKKSKQFLL